MPPLGANVDDDKEDDTGSRLVVNLAPGRFRRALAAAWTRAIEPVEFAGRTITSINHFKNILGIFPKGWRCRSLSATRTRKKEILVRLDGGTPKVIEAGQP